MINTTDTSNYPGLKQLDKFLVTNDAFIADGIEHGGSEDEGYFYIDEGGRIELVDVAEDGIMNFVYVGVDHD